MQILHYPITVIKNFFFFEKLNSPIVITYKKYPYKIIYVNSSWEKLCGYSLTEIFGKSIFILKYRYLAKNLFINKKKDGTLFINFIKKKYIVNTNFSIGITIFYKILQPENFNYKIG